MLATRVGIDSVDYERYLATHHNPQLTGKSQRLDFIPFPSTTICVTIPLLCYTLFGSEYGQKVNSH